MSGPIPAMLAALVAAPAAADCSHLPVPSAAVALANDNRAPAGTMVDGELTVRLVVRLAAWYPDGPEGCGIDVLAFEEEGGAARIPGPLIRVPAGTRISVVVRNTSDHALLVRGLQDRPAERLDSTLIAGGDTHVFDFQATTPGSYFYWARELGSAPLGSGDDGQLAGALVVDPPNGIPPPDRILVLTRWNPPGHLPLGHLPESDPAARRFEINVINGLSWPNTERLTYTTADTVRLRVINAAGDAHVMHLHGFHYRVTSRGDNGRDVLFPTGEGPLLVSEILTPGTTMAIEWVPTRPGNWIFHCHLQRHMSAGQRLERVPGARGAEHGVHQGASGHEMAGLILGITVDAAPEYVAGDDDPRHSLRLFANARDGVFGERPGYGFVVQEGIREPAPDSVRIPGSPLLLRQGEPTEIVVHNRIGKPLSVHWHGLEIESYFDGVAGWSGHPGRLAPPIAPGDSFTVRITPPRAGTFIYHVHGGGPLDLTSGLYGAFIVLDANAPRSLPESDRIFILSRLPGNDTATVVNGTRHPPPVDVRAGETYRFRIIGIMPQEGDFVTLRDPAGIASWELMARDGVEGSTARLPGVSAGMTMDFGLTASAAGALMLEIETLDLVGQRLGRPIRIPVRVRDEARPWASPASFPVPRSRSPAPGQGLRLLSLPPIGVDLR
jgi:manganese oxidase